MASHSLFWEFPYVFTLDAIKQNNFTDGFFSFFQLKNVIHNLVYHRVYKIKKMTHTVMMKPLLIHKIDIFREQKIQMVPVGIK